MSWVASLLEVIVGLIVIAIMAKLILMFIDKDS